MTRTSHKKNRPFDFKLISLVQPHPVLYERHWGGLSTFDCMKEKNRVWNKISTAMGASPDFCLSRWNNLRNRFQRELRYCHELCPKQGIIRGSTWPYLERMRFMEKTIRFNKPDKPQPQSKYGNESLQLEEDNDTISESLNSESYEIKEDFEEYEYSENKILTDKYSKEQSGQRSTNFQQMTTLLNKIPNRNLSRIERRIMAYLCKCQLRAIANEDIDDLTI